MDIRNTYVPTEKQKLAHSLPQRYKLFGGAMGGGKSRYLCEEAKELCMEYPGNRVLMARYHLSDFKNTTLKTLLECLPGEIIDNHNKAEGVITLINGSEIIYMGLAEEQSVSKLKSMELGAFLFDEASEIPFEIFLMAQSRLRRVLPRGGTPRYFGLLASNPDDCWLKDYFLLGEGGDDAVFIPALPRDNNYLPAGYEEQLRKTYPEDWIKRFLEGSWDELTGGDKVIPYGWVASSVNREVPVVDKRIVACDVARYGEDEIVIQYGKGFILIEQDITRGKSTMETAGRILNMYQKKEAQVAVIDEVNMGGGVVDRLREMKLKILGVNAGNVPLFSTKFQRLKDEMLFYARGLFEEGKVSIINDKVLIRQLSAVKYRYLSNGKVVLEKKEDVKKRLGQSPDRADCFIMLLWGNRFLRDHTRDFKRGKPLDFLTTQRTNTYGWDYKEEK